MQGELGPGVCESRARLGETTRRLAGWLLMAGWMAATRAECWQWKRARRGERLARAMGRRRADEGRTEGCGQEWLSVRKPSLLLLLRYGRRWCWVRFGRRAQLALAKVA